MQEVRGSSPRATIQESPSAAAVCFAAWLDARGGTGAAEVAAGLAQVRRFFALHGESRFSRCGDDDADRPTINRAGFRREGIDGTEFLVLPSVWRDEICGGFDSQAIAGELVARGVLVPDAGDGKPQSRHRLPGVSVRRVYHLTAAVLGDEGGDDA
jgi:putative DNA primase/helicase